MTNFSKKAANVFLWIMNIGLLVIGCLLACALLIEVWEIFHISVNIIKNNSNYTELVEEILVFFLYFEFIALIVKYFRHNFHFPLRYFIYIGITAIVRLIIVQHDAPSNVLLWSISILILVISLAIAEKYIKKD